MNAPLWKHFLIRPTVGATSDLGLIQENIKACAESCAAVDAKIVHVSVSRAEKMKSCKSAAPRGFIRSLSRR
jgi:hypothetical protein